MPGRMKTRAKTYANQRRGSGRKLDPPGPRQGGDRKKGTGVRGRKK